jgi:hypothetical protein
LRSRRSDVSARSLVRLTLLFLVAFSCTWGSRRAGADEASDAGSVAQARDEFVKGAALVKDAKWGEALGAFERANRLHRHAITTYNIGACERALSNYTRARRTLKQALAENVAARGAELPESVVTDVQGYLAQLDSLIASATVTLTPANAAVTVDGRPLEVTDARADPPLLVAGLRPPGSGEPPPSNVFKVELDPGAHVFTLSRKGFADAVVNRQFLPGAATELKLALDRLPATLHVESYPAGAIVTVDRADVGATPVDVSRPTGSYKVVVRKSGYVTYETEVVAQPGEDVNLSPNLPKEKTPLTQRWWFWTGIGVVVTGAAAGTYFATRTSPTPTRPAPDCGGLGYCMQMQ